MISGALCPTQRLQHRVCFSKCCNLLAHILILMVANCSAECSFSQLKQKNPNRTTMRQEKLDFLSLLMFEADLLRKINVDDIT